eukprot:1777721-Heterocapsa_arctica.AAC.1
MMGEMALPGDTPLLEFKVLQVLHWRPVSPPRLSYAWPGGNCWDGAAFLIRLSTLVIASSE